MYRAPVEACCDAAEVLELVEASLDGVTSLVGFKVVRDWLLSRWVAWDDGFGAHFGDQPAQGIGIICFIRQHPLGRQAVEQGWRQRRIATLARR